VNTINGDIFFTGYYRSSDLDLMGNHIACAIEFSASFYCQCYFSRC